MSFHSSDPVVSIPLCTYNGANYLADQIESLLAQSHSNLEILAFDDGSTDGTVEILSDYARQDARIRVHVNPTNLGFRNNFVQAISSCRGDYIAPCDQDDVWLPGKLQLLIECIGNHSLAYCNSQFIDASGARLNARISDFLEMIEGDDPAPFAFANCVSGHAMLFRAHLCSKLSVIPADFFHDWWIAAVAAASGGIVYCDQELVLYRQHGSNVTNFLKQGYIPRAQRPRGYRLRELREVGRRLAQLASLECSHQMFLKEIAALWESREAQWFSWRLCGHMLTQGVRLRCIHHLPRYKIMKDALQMSPGVRIKRLVSPRAYC